MTFDVAENSAFDGSPVEGFEFARSTQTWRYTSSDENTTIGGNIYTSVAIQRSKIEQNQDPGRNPITLTVPRNLDFVQQYIASPPTDSIQLTIRRTHRTDGTNQVIVTWIGRVVNVKFEDSQVTIRCEPIFTSLKRPALRRLYQTTCPHLLYGDSCRAARSTFELTTNITVVSATVLSSTQIGLQADGYYTGGFVEWTVSGVVNKRLILTHVGNQVTLNLPLTGISTGNEVKVAPGCDRRLTTCINKFNNVVNYGGFPYIPGKNPFDGTPVF